MSISMDATNLALGTYRDQLTITSNDPDESSLAVDILLSVIPYQHTFLPDDELWEKFGYSVSLDGDLAIVGAPSYISRVIPFSPGMAQIYRFDGRTWQPEQQLQASDWSLGDRFGSLVKISGEVAIVGAGSSSVYLFRWDGNRWQEEQKLVGGEGIYNFGATLDVSEDVAFIGARGAVYVYRFDGSSWPLSQTLSASDENESSFGSSLSASGNYLLVGAPQEDGSGVAHLYRFDGSSWIEEAKLMGEPTKEHRFGTSLSLSGDNALIMANHSAYFWRRDQNSDQWQEEASFSFNSQSYLGGFPSRSSIALDQNWAVVPISNYLLAIFHWNGSSWQQETMPYPIERSSDGYKTSYLTLDSILSLSGSRLLIGDPLQPDRDSAYLYDLSAKFPDLTVSRSDLSLSLVEGTSHHERLTITNHTTETIALQCQSGCTGHSWLNVTPISSTMPPMASQEVLIEVDTTTLNREHKSHLLTITSDKADIVPIKVPISLRVIPPERFFAADDLATDNQFGQAVSISGEWALVGATRDGSGGQEPGKAYLYRWDGSNWQEETQLSATDGTLGNGFGRAVSLSDSVAVVGAPFDEQNGRNAGAVYVYRRNSEGWQESKLTASDGTSSNYFGVTVSIHGDLLLVGAPFANANDHHSGAVYVFRWNSEGWQQESKLSLSQPSSSS